MPAAPPAATDDPDGSDAGVGRARRLPSVAGALVAIASVDFRRILHDRIALFSMLVLPVLIIIVVGATIGSGPRHLPIGVLDQDGGAVAHQFAEQLTKDGSADLHSYTERGDLERDIRTQAISAGIVIPRGFSDAARSGTGADIVLLIPQSQGGGQAARAVVQSAADQVGAKLAATAFVKAQLGPDAQADRAVENAGNSMRTVAVNRRAVGQRALANDNPFSYTAPSNLVLFVFITSLASGSVLVESRRLGITRRSLGAPIRPSTLLLGSGVMRYLTALAQAALVIVIGALLFGVTWGQPLGVAVLVLVYALVGAGTGLLVGAVARNPEQAMAVGIPVAIGMGMLGGCMWPLDVVPEPLRVIGHLTPKAWAMDGFVGLIYNGESLAGIAPQIGVLALYAAVLLTVAGILLRRALTR